VETPGEYLSRERELRGVTVADISEALKMSVGLITALEHDDHETLPHPTYVKGFVRAYAVYLGIDEDDAVLRYEAYQSDRRLEAEKVKKFTAEAANEYKTTPPMPRMVSSERKGGFALGGLLGRGRRGSNRTVLLFVGIGIVIVVLYLVFYGRGGDELSRVVATPAPETKLVEPAQKVEKAELPARNDVKELAPVKAGVVKPAAEAPQSRAKTATAVSAAVKGAAASSATEKKKLLLEVKASDTTWIMVDIDGKEQREALLQPGETVRWRGAKVFF